MFCGKRRKFLGIDLNVLGDRAVTYWSDLYGLKGVQNVSAETGFKISRVEKWFARTANPNSVVIVIGVGVWGLDFLEALFGDDAPEWLKAACRESKADRLEQQILQLRAQQQALR